MVLPDMEPMTSLGRKLTGEMRFSTAGMTAVTLTGTLFSARANIAPLTAAPPAMSLFMPFMPAACLRLYPPESKVTPLPTRTMGRAPS